MEYLKFLSQSDPVKVNNCCVRSYNFVIISGNDQLSEPMIIDVFISEQDQASLEENKYNINKAFFTIAKNYLIRKIKMGYVIQLKEEISNDSLMYLSLYDMLDDFNDELIPAL